MAKDKQPARATSGADVAALLDRFGGPRALAATLGLSPSTIQGWRSSGRIPKDRHDAILAASDDARLGVTRKDLTGAASLADREINLDSQPVDPPSPPAADAAQAEPPEADVDADHDDDEPTPDRGGRSGGGWAAVFAVLALIVAFAALLRPAWGPFVAEAPGVAGLLVAPPPAAPAPPPPPPSVAPARVGSRQGNDRYRGTGGRAPLIGPAETRPCNLLETSICRAALATRTSRWKHYV